MILISKNIYMFFLLLHTTIVDHHSNSKYAKFKSLSIVMNCESHFVGLFHRAILMSGASFSTWWLVEDPIHYAVKVVNSLKLHHAKQYDEKRPRYSQIF